MKAVSLLGLLLPFLSLVAANPATVTFNGAVSATNLKGLTVTLTDKSQCTVEYQNTAQLGVNCTVVLDYTAPNGKVFETSLTGGVNLIQVNGALHAQVNYALTLPSNPNSPSTNPLQVSGLLGGMVSIPINGAISVNTPVAICASNITQSLGDNNLLENFIQGIVSQILGDLGSDACITFHFNAVGGSGASLAIVASVDLLDATKATNPQLLNEFVTLIGGSQYVPIQHSVNIGATIQGLQASGSVVASRMRGLSATAAYLDSNGNFLLGQQPLSGGAIAGIVIGCLAFVGLVAGVVIFRRRIFPARRV